MTDDHRRTISFEPLIDLRDRVARLQNPDHGVDADLFRLFDGRSVIKTKRTIARFVAETDWLGLANIDEDVFASETHESESHDPYGFLDQNGNFVREPVLHLIPEYTRAFDIAFLFKQSVIGFDYTLRFSEIRGSLIPEFEAGLHGPSGQLRSSHVSQDIAVAIIKVCLDLLIADPDCSRSYVISTDDSVRPDVKK